MFLTSSMQEDSAASIDGTDAEGTGALVAPESSIIAVVPSAQQESAVSGEGGAAEAPSVQQDSAVSGEGVGAEAASAQRDSAVSDEGGDAEGEVQQVQFFVMYKAVTVPLFFPFPGTQASREEIKERRRYH